MPNQQRIKDENTGPADISNKVHIHAVLCIHYFTCNRQHAHQTERSQHSQVPKRLHAGSFCALQPFNPKINGLQDSWWNISMSGLVILAELDFEISCGKTKQTNKRR